MAIDQIEKDEAERFKGLSVRREYGLYRFDVSDEDELKEEFERPEHGTVMTKRIIRQEKPIKHIAQGLYW